MKRFLFFLKTLPFWSVIFLIVGGSNLRIGEYPVLPALFLIPIYYWLIFRPDWLRLWGLFIIGIFYDALMGADLGLSSLLLMISTLVGHHVRPLLNPQYFPLMWGIFCFYSFCYLSLYGFLTSGGPPLLFSWIYGILLYPLIVWLLGHLHTRLQAHV